MNRVTALAVRYEGALPFLAALLWWVAMYPGLLAEDSFYHLQEASSGDITVWFTAWWTYLVAWLSLGTAVVGLVTLAGVLILAWAVRSWMWATFPPGPPRAWTMLAICLSPVVGAMGIQVRHDGWMTAGLLLWTAVVVRTRGLAIVTRGDVLALTASAALMATRHNGLPAVLLAGVGALLLFREHRVRFAIGLAAVATVSTALTTAATRAAGQPYTVDPAQTVEWAMADVSCLISQGVEPTEREWAVLERIAHRRDWPQSRACRYVNPLQFAPSFRYAHAEGQVGAMLATWGRLALREPMRMADVHAKRIALFLPPFLTGTPDSASIKFVHASIIPNDRGLAWRFPRAAATMQLSIRLWNRYRVWLANAALWLLAMAAVWRLSLAELPLGMTLLVSGALWLGLIATAPVSEGRYGLFILICGHATVTYWVLARISGRSAPA